MKNKNGLFPIGVYFGKFLPCHRGHLLQTIEAATQCEKLYVVISENRIANKILCEKAGIPVLSYQLRKQWLSQELQDMENIEILQLDETDMPTYPNGWIPWSDEMRRIIPGEINAFFCGEQEYKDKLPEFFPNAEVVLFDPNRNRFPISATMIREDTIENWDYILGPARPYFAKKVLIVGSESCGKTTLTKYLAKIYHTSWSEEVGRYYAKEYLGGDETIFTDADFGRIAHLQVEQDFQALRHANKVCFFDTDATITDYYSELYMGHPNKLVESYIDPSKFDLVLYLHPDVAWVNDGMRLNGDQERRENLDAKLQAKFIDNGFTLTHIRGNYNERLTMALAEVDKLLGLTS